MMNQITVPESLKAFFAEHKKLALAFSGGVDSAYLLYAAQACGCNVRAYYVKTAFQPEFELNDARRLADQLGADMHILHLDALADDRVARNPADRCYFCKQNLFSAMIQRAWADGYAAIMDGTNASDDASDRPGMRALREMQVLSPLRACGITKAQVREFSRAAGLFTWNKPAYACLATRIPTGENINIQQLQAVEAAEEAMFAMGFSDLRVRVFHGAARLQLPADQMPRAIEMRGEIMNALKPWFENVLLDLKER